MNYKDIYNSLCSKAKMRNQGDEIHHIIPKCLGGSNDSLNLVNLTYREHFIAHKLLVKIYKDNISLYRALLLLRGKCSGFIPSRLYEKCKSLQHSHMKKNNPMFSNENVIKHLESKKKTYQKQSEVAKKRNKDYWSNDDNRKALSMRNKQRHLNKGIIYIVIDITNEQEIRFRTKKEVSTFINSVPSTVYNYCNTGKIYKNKWRIDSVAKSNPQNSD